MKIGEIVPESEHVENLLYLREITKIKIDNWVEASQNGKLPTEERVYEALEILQTIQNCLDLYPKVKKLEELDRKNEKVPYYLSPEYISRNEKRR